MTTLRDTLKSSHLFKGLTNPEIDSIAEISREESFPAGAVVFTEGSIANNLYVVKQGKVAIDMRVGLGSRTPRR